MSNMNDHFTLRDTFLPCRFLAAFFKLWKTDIQEGTLHPTPPADPTVLL